MNRKGFIDQIYLVVVFITAFFMLIVGTFIFNSVKDRFNLLPQSNDTNVQNVISKVEASNANSDNLVVMLFGGMVITILITLYFIRSNPLFFIIGIIGLVITLFLAIFLKDAFTDVINSNANFTEIANDNAKSTWVFDMLPVLLLVIISVFLIFMYVNRGAA